MPALFNKAQYPVYVPALKNKTRYTSQDNGEKEKRITFLS